MDHQITTVWCDFQSILIRKNLSLGKRRLPYNWKSAHNRWLAKGSVNHAQAILQLGNCLPVQKQGLWLVTLAVAV